ncbi:MAG: hypothetical protein JO029_04230 [Candidatus Eremiobacteraeota bacterium]|nr:hypothetical protein [Candidatus Eremiobacteraeota bacterium]MBV8332761.1 hypothetical protein [Candidatus Eremiobacteraeota bacterium]MBV8433473.1 hypothetical protein [Candidatus Eremiobacteraeota bacterium]
MDGQKCRHDQCTCYVDLGQTYCSDRCRQLDDADGDAPPRARCGCRHAGCEAG